MPSPNRPRGYIEHILLKVLPSIPCTAHAVTDLVHAEDKNLATSNIWRALRNLVRKGLVTKLEKNLYQVVTKED